MESIAPQLIFRRYFQVENVHDSVALCCPEKKAFELLNVASVNNTAKVLHVGVV